MMAVLQGLDVVSFPYLWPCQFALGGQPCHFCYQGNMTLAMKQAGQPLPPIASPDDVAEAVEYCVREEGIRDVQLTGGSEVDSACGEVPLAVNILAAIDRRLGLDNIPGEIYVYTSAPKDPAAVDALFAAGMDRVAYDLNVWDEAIFEQACPGIFRHIGREQQLRALEYAARRHGPNKVCSAFVIGLEPLESLLAGAEYVAQSGNRAALFALAAALPSGARLHHPARPGLLSPRPPGVCRVVCQDISWSRRAPRG